MRNYVVGLVGQRKADRYKIAEHLHKHKHFEIDILHEPGLLALVVLGADNVEAVTNLARGHEIEIAGHKVNYKALYFSFFEIFGRQSMGFNLWLALAEQRWKKLQGKTIVVPDIETPDEAEQILNLGGEILWLRSTMPTIHPEQDWSDFATAIVDANQDYQHLYRDIHNLWPDDTTH